MRRAARLDLVDIQLRLGRHADLVAELSDRVTVDPLDERAAGQLVTAEAGVPAQLPADVSVFAGRTAEPATLDSLDGQTGR